MMKSLASRIIALSLLGSVIASAIIAVAVLRIFEQSLDSQLNNHLAAYTDLFSGVSIATEDSLSSEDASILNQVPRYWQIQVDGKPWAKSNRLKSEIKLDGDKSQEQFSFTDSDGTPIVAYAKRFDYPSGRQVTFIFGLESQIAEAYKADLTEQFRQGVAYTIVAATILLLTFAGLTTIFVLQPVVKARDALRKVQMGQAGQLEGTFPSEIGMLTSQINKLLTASAARIDRYRIFSSNLAHSLRTPLTIIRNESEKASVQEQVRNMLQIIDRNLAKANAASTEKASPLRTDIGQVAGRVAEQLCKVHNREYELVCSHESFFPADETETYEVLGNLIENACKFGKQHILISLKPNEIWIEDDGPGIPANDRKSVLKRGNRLDESVAGSGIGLAITKDILHLHGCELELADSSLGGLRAIIHLPRDR